MNSVRVNNWAVFLVHIIIAKILLWMSSKTGTAGILTGRLLTATIPKKSMPPP